MITALYASVLAIIMTILQSYVIYLRRKLRVGTGHNGQVPLEKAIRIHANFIESVPMILVLLLCYELMDGSMKYLHIMGAALVFARIIHALGLRSSRGTSLGRFYGTIITSLVLLSSATLNLATIM